MITSYRYIYISQDYQGPKRAFKDIKDEFYAEQAKSWPMKMGPNDGPKATRFATEVYEVMPDGQLIFCDADYDSGG